jgi:hypothetical protein
MSEIKVNKISPKQTCTQLTLGDSGDTIIIPAGATITNNGTATGFGRTGSVNWDTTVKTTTVTAVSGTGYFVNTTSGAITVNLPAATAGDIVAVSDYANTAATNNITIFPNGTNKINGQNFSYKIATNGVALTLIYVDSTIGWKDINDATLDATGVSTFVIATGGTVLTCGDYKTHVFTGPGSFVVSQAGTPAGSNSVEYLVVAGGGVDAGYGAGGGGAGGFRTNYPSPTTAGLSVTLTSYPITVGGGGGNPFPAPSGTPSIFSTITSSGGGPGGVGFGAGPGPGISGGSGGGGGSASGGPYPAGTGNTPPVSPPQGNPGGAGGPPSGTYSSGGGGGASQAGTNFSPSAGGPGGDGSYLPNGVFGPTAPSYGTTGPVPAVRYFAGGGGGASSTNNGGTPGTGGAGGGGRGGADGPFPANSGGTVNTGGGSGGFVVPGGGAGGSGIVLIRYKFQ